MYIHVHQCSKQLSQGAYAYTTAYSYCRLPACEQSIVSQSAIPSVNLSSSERKPLTMAGLMCESSSEVKCIRNSLHEALYCVYVSLVYHYLLKPVPARTTAVRSMGAMLQEDGRKQHKEGRKGRDKGGGEEGEGGGRSISLLLPHLPTTCSPGC